MLDDLYARADDIMEAATPVSLATAKAEIHALIAEAALVGNRYGYDRATPDNPQARRYRAVVVVLRDGKAEFEEIQFSSVPGPLTTERAATMEAVYRHGPDTRPYVVRTSITRV